MEITQEAKQASIAFSLSLCFLLVFINAQSKLQGTVCRILVFYNNLHVKINIVK